MNLQLDTPAEYYARVALIVHTDASGTQGAVMQHALREEKGQVVMAEGVNVTQDTVDALLRLNAMQTLVFVPEHVVAVGSNSLAWVVPAGPRRLLFGGALDKAVAALDGQVLAQPRLLFIVRGGQMYVYALKGQGRPQADTRLCLAPFFNIFANNSICNGSMVRPAGLSVDQTQAWEEAFFYSNFVKSADGQKRHAFKGTYRELWDAATEAGAFLDEWLVETDVTLQQALGGRK